MVFKAKSQRDGRDVAVRLLSTPPGIIAELILSQAQRAKKVRHEALASVVDAGRSDDGTVFVVSELASGTPLDQWAQSAGIPPLRKVVEFVHRLCTALQVAEREGLHHETLAPHNILISALGRGPEDRLQGQLLDLGVPAIAHSQPLRLQAVVFMAPEQLIQLQRGSSVGATADATSNIYALGGVLYLLCTGEAPYPARNLGELLSAHAERSLTRPSRINPVLPSSLSSVIMQALSPDPTARYPSLDAFAHALLRTLQPIHRRRRSIETDNATPTTEPAHLAESHSEAEPYEHTAEPTADASFHTPNPVRSSAAWPHSTTVDPRRRIPTGSFSGELAQTENQDQGPFVVPRGGSSASEGSAARRTGPSHSQTVPVQTRTPTDTPSSTPIPTSDAAERQGSPPLPPMVPPYEGRARTGRDSQGARTSTIRGRYTTGAPLPPVQPEPPATQARTVDPAGVDDGTRRPSHSRPPQAQRASTAPHPGPAEGRHAPDLTTSRIRLEVTLAEEDEEPILDHGRKRGGRLSAHGTYAPYVRVGGGNSPNQWQRIRPILAVIVGLLSLVLAVLVYRSSSAPRSATMYVSTPSTAAPTAAPSPAAALATDPPANTAPTERARTDEQTKSTQTASAKRTAQGRRWRSSRETAVRESTARQPRATKPPRTVADARAQAELEQEPTAAAISAPIDSKPVATHTTSDGDRNAQAAVDIQGGAASAATPTRAEPSPPQGAERAMTLDELLDMPLPTRAAPATAATPEQPAQPATPSAATAQAERSQSPAQQAERSQSPAQQAERSQGPAQQAASPSEPPAQPPPAAPQPGQALTAQVRFGELEVHGSLATSVIRRSVERARGDFERCYENAAVQAGRNAFGPLTISFELDFRGRSRAPAVEGAKLPGLASCLRDALGRIATNRAPDTGTVRTKLRLDFLP